MNDNKTNTGGIASLIFGIIGLFVFPIFIGAVAILLSLLSEKKDGSNTAGFILGIIDILFGIFMLSVQY